MQNRVAQSREQGILCEEVAFFFFCVSGTHQEIHACTCTSCAVKYIKYYFYMNLHTSTILSAVPVGSRPVIHRVFAEAKNINGLAALFIKSRQEILSRGPRSIPPCIHCVRRYKPQCHGVQTATNTQQQSTYFLCARCVQKRLKAHPIS